MAFSKIPYNEFVTMLYGVPSDYNIKLPKMKPVNMMLPKIKPANKKPLKRKPSNTKPLKMKPIITKRVTPIQHMGCYDIEADGGPKYGIIAVKKETPVEDPKLQVAQDGLHVAYELTRNKKIMKNIIVLDLEHAPKKKRRVFNSKPNITKGTIHRALKQIIKAGPKFKPINRIIIDV